MKDTNTFQLALIGGFIALGVFGLIAFSVFEAKPNEAELIGNVLIWGTLEQDAMSVVREKLDEVLPSNYEGNIVYRQRPEETFSEDLVDALAAGEGPDLFILKHEDILKQRNKIFVVPYENYSLREFKDTFIEGAEIFVDANGVLAFPFTVDPLVMYWNRDILTRGGFPTVPEYWDEFFDISPKLTKRDTRANILTATVPFGEYSNVTNAKAIVSGLILQADDPIVTRNQSNSTVAVLGNLSGSDSSQPAVSALRFYTEFSNPIKAVYSWNRALSASKQSFLAGDLAFYFGFASELQDLRRANPNLNFDVARIPQIRDDTTPATFGSMTGVALLKSTDNLVGSFRVASLLASNPVLGTLAEETGLPPISRQLLRNAPVDDAVQPVFFESALISHAWLEPDAEQTEVVFKDMIEAISSGRLSISRAVDEARIELSNLIK